MQPDTTCRKGLGRNEAFLVSLVARGLPSGATSRPEPESVSAVDWGHLDSLARRHGVVPLVYRGLLDVGPDVAPEPVLGRFRRGFEENASFNMLRVRELKRVLELFSDHGVAVFPFKGPITALLVYDNLAMRQFGDLDLCVRPEQVRQATTLLVAEGYTPSCAIDEAEMKLLLGTQKHLTLKRGDTMIELHWEIVHKRFGVDFDHEQLWDRLVPTPLLGGSIPTFSPEDLLLYLCMHGTLHCWERLGWLCDVAQLVSRSGRRLQWEWILGGARKMHMERALTTSILLSSSLFGTYVPAEILGTAKETRAAERLAETIPEWIFSDPSRQDTLGRIRFQSKVRERRRDGLHFATQALFAPNDADRDRWRLTAALRFLYYPLRMGRLTAKYGRKLVDQARTAITPRTRRTTARTTDGDAS